ncbi:hypothetical protein [Pedobacter heparinus]|uniref:hypothetical protein n=1 Tax=Pedobacter heparinus TaxID=984 RepID=UPI00292E09B2|nr:hypothetical protein [Pedobacter heparinus]
MKTNITKLLVTTILILLVSATKSLAQVTPSTSGVTLMCSDGALDFGAPAASTTWIVRYSATSTTTPSTGVTLTGNTVAAADLQTGYYYLISKGTAAGSCESEPQEIPVYKLAPIAAQFTFADYCSENAAASAFTGSAVAADPNVTTYAYQWYTVSGGTPTVIQGATNATYTPTLVNTTTSDITTTYRLQVGYLIGTDKYCGTTIDHDVKVLAKPTKPTVTITGASAGSW